jgi:hypothetical protein
VLAGQDGQPKPAPSSISHESRVEPIDAQWRIAHQFSRLLLRVQK